MLRSFSEVEHNTMSDHRTSSFKKAVKAVTPLKISIQGISFSGKTMSAIKLAKGLAKGREVFVIDSENGSAALYDHLDFSHASVRPPFRPDDYIKLLREAVDAGAGAVVIDSGSHAWQYILDYKDQLDTAGGRGAQWSNWAKAKPLWQALKDAILQSPVHVVVCFREAAEYVVDSSNDGQGNKQSRVNKVGTKAKAEEGSEYEFTVSWKLDKQTHLAFVEKDRTGLFDGRSFIIDEGIGHELLQWLGDGDFISTPEWELLRAGLSDDVRGAIDDAEKVRKDQAKSILTNRKIGVEVQKLLAAAAKEADVNLTQSVIDADRYGATDADRLIRYICQTIKTDPVPIIRVHTGSEAPRVHNQAAGSPAPKEAPAAAAGSTNPAAKPAADAKPKPAQKPAPAAEDEKTALMGHVNNLVHELEWPLDPVTRCKAYSELLGMGAIAKLADLGEVRLANIVEKLKKIKSGEKPEPALITDARTAESGGAGGEKLNFDE